MLTDSSLPSSYAANDLVTSDLVVRKGQIPCKRYCKLGHQTPYSRHQQRREGAWSQPMPGMRR